MVPQRNPKYTRSPTGAENDVIKSARELSRIISPTTLLSLEYPRPPRSPSPLGHMSGKQVYESLKRALKIFG